MAFNLNTSRKPEVQLNKHLINEMITMYGIPCLYLYSEKINQDKVFKDFTHNKIPKDKSVQIYLLPENSEDWEGDTIYNQFGFYNQWTQNLFISRDTVLELYPDFDQQGRHLLVNSLIVLPSNTVLEVTHVETYDPGVNNLWAYGDENSVYKLVVKTYDHNIGDQGVSEIKDQIELEEGPNPGSDQDNIFEYDEDIDVSSIDDFFKELENNTKDLEEISETEPELINNTDSPFGDLS